MVAATFIGASQNDREKTMSANTMLIFNKIKTCVKWLALIAGFAFVALLVFLYIEDRHEKAQQRAIQEWNWNHYTGWRLTRDFYPSTADHGIWTDNKTGKDCTDKIYPGFPACPAQEHVVNGKPAQEIDLSAGMVPNESDGTTFWVTVDLFEEFGGTRVGPAPELPKEIVDRRCKPSSYLWHKNIQWVCVKSETRPEGLPDDAIIEPTN
jgi:hypothetical protein